MRAECCAGTQDTTTVGPGWDDVAQPSQFGDSTGGGRSFGRRPIVLARLPRVGAASRTVELTSPATQPPTFAQATRFYVDPRHAVSSARETAPAEQHGEQTPTSQRRHHGPHRRPNTEATSAASALQSMANASLPVKIASYSGLIVTLALAASAILLYWMIIVPGQTPTTDFGNSYDSYGAVKIEIPDFEFPTAPPSAPKTTSPAAAAEPLFEDASEQVTVDEPAAVVAQQVPAWNSTPRMSADQQSESPSAAPAPPELMPASENSESPSDDTEIYNDASAQAYPTTDHPLAWDLTVLGVVDAAPEDGALFFPVPQLTRQPEPPLIFR